MLAISYSQMLFHFASFAPYAIFLNCSVLLSIIVLTVWSESGFWSSYFLLPIFHCSNFLSELFQSHCPIIVVFLCSVCVCVCVRVRVCVCVCVHMCVCVPGFGMCSFDTKYEPDFSKLKGLCGLTHRCRPVQQPPPQPLPPPPKHSGQRAYLVNMCNHRSTVQKG